MRYSELNKIKKLYFTPKDVAWALEISYNSARVTCSRYTTRGVLVRLKRNFYTLPQTWENLSEEEMYAIANLLQIPSYVSLTTALSFYNISTQIQRDFYESISLKRTKEVTIAKKTFIFTKIDKRLYDKFIKKDGYFIATPEKALLDAFYLTSLKRYNLDFDAIDIKKVDKERVRKLIKMYPKKVNKLWGQHVGSI